jgi:hypothetical protein
MTLRANHAITISVKKARRCHQRFYNANLPTDHLRPLTRADCEEAGRPCPYVGCKYNLYLDVSPETGSIKINFPSVDPLAMDENASCALDLTERMGMTLDEVGSVMNVTRERIRQIETIALDKFYLDFAEMDLARFLDWLPRLPPG